MARKNIRGSQVKICKKFQAWRFILYFAQKLRTPYEIFLKAIFLYFHKKTLLVMRTSLRHVPAFYRQNSHKIQFIAYFGPGWSNFSLSYIFKISYWSFPINTYNPHPQKLLEFTMSGWGKQRLPSFSHTFYRRSEVGLSFLWYLLLASHNIMILKTL